MSKKGGKAPVLSGSQSAARDSSECQTVAVEATRGSLAGNFFATPLTLAPFLLYNQTKT